MTTEDITHQHRAVAFSLLQMLDGVDPSLRRHVLASVPVCTDDNVKEDFDYLLGSTAWPDMLTERLEATGNHPLAFLRLLAGASARPDLASALSLFDALPSEGRVEVSARMRRIIAHGFGSNPNPSTELLERLTSVSGPLDLIEHRHTHQSGLASMVDSIAKASITANSDKHLPLLVANRQIFPHLFPSRVSFWSLVAAAASSLSEKSMAELARLQDDVLVSIPTHHMAPAARDKESAMCASIVQAQVEALAEGASGSQGDASIRTLVELLKMDLPMNPLDQGLGARVDWRVLSALAPVQQQLGEDYERLARPALQRGSKDVVMDALVFGADAWWSECLDCVRQAPEPVASEMTQYVDFLEGEIPSRIAEDGSIDRVFDDLHDVSPVQAGELGERLIRRIPELTRVVGSESQRREWSAFMEELIGISKPRTASVFRAIAIAMTTEPTSEPTRPAPRM